MRLIFEKGIQDCREFEMKSKIPTPTRALFITLHGKHLQYIVRMNKCSGMFGRISVSCNYAGCIWFGAVHEGGPLINYLTIRLYLSVTS